ncbi:class I SAM-dependent methyltransferase [Spartinivicinus poritis]|uniref:Class I SAM-dependent methyltransferase n=1 Tax=Spartinivicinus poritis TaxID=2994640 RepID=A0ABT5UCJ3_9GAMM|nr:class I SAM-dependent methyltransferase [Spartinivicinus sp. A2-2]MDE1462809.1 class I SAM-dependent methyltransferase [Spartinivicinus sp. A2-2]
MKFSNGIAAFFNWCLNELLPPIIRDNKYIFSPIYYILFKEKYKYFLEFRDNFFNFSEKEITDYYRVTEDCDLKAKSDTSDEVLRELQSLIIGNNVLDVGCGSGIISEYVDGKIDYLCCDIARCFKKKYKFCYCTANNLSFKDKRISTIVCSHVLEHLINPIDAIKEFRRVASERIIIILPRERPYKFGFNLHTHFFPYRYNIELLLKSENKYEIKKIKNEWIYIEDLA